MPILYTIFVNHARFAQESRNTLCVWMVRGLLLLSMAVAP